MARVQRVHSSVSNGYITLVVGCNKVDKLGIS